MGLWDPLWEGFDLLKEVLKEDWADLKDKQELITQLGEEEHSRKREQQVQETYNGREYGEHK